MAHCLIFGMTESGKTTLAKRLAARYKHHGIPVLVLDPLNDPEWNADLQTTDPEEFLRVFWGSRRCMAFIDEAGESVGRYNSLMHATATRGRHWGHSVHFISQRGVQLSPTVRDQCSHIFLFTTSLQDCKVHANEWNQPRLLMGNALQKGNYFHTTRFGTIEQGSLFGVAQNGTHTDNRDGTQRTGAKDPETPPKKSADSGPPGSSANVGDPADSGADPADNGADPPADPA